AALAAKGDDAGSARTAEVPGTGALIIAISELNGFLCGESALDGVWFGEKHPNKVGNFWWRQHVRRVLSAATLQLSAPVTNARDGRASDNNGEARDAEVDRTLPW